MVLEARYGVRDVVIIGEDVVGGGGTAGFSPAKYVCLGNAVSC